jgi:rhamnogalacturonan endolyase
VAVDVDLDVDADAGTLSKDVACERPSAVQEEQAGQDEWRVSRRLVQHEIDVGWRQLKAGSNASWFTVTRYVQWRGVMWDSVILEWQS